MRCHCVSAAVDPSRVGVGARAPGPRMGAGEAGLGEPLDRGGVQVWQPPCGLRAERREGPGPGVDSTGRDGDVIG